MNSIPLANRAVLRGCPFRRSAIANTTINKRDGRAFPVDVPVLSSMELYLNHDAAFTDSMIVVL